jgi:hypothetical protein
MKSLNQNPPAGGKNSLMFSIILFLLFLFFPSNIYAKDYSIKSADFTVQINRDGSATITEKRTYVFDGSFSWADQWIPLKDGSTVTDFEMSENGVSYYPVDVIGDAPTTTNIIRINFTLSGFILRSMNQKLWDQHKISNTVTNHTIYQNFTGNWF